MFKDDVMCKKIFIFLPILFVASCGGGGGSNDSAPANIGPISQTISFAQVGPVELQLGDSFSNTADGPGEGEVTYNSSDETIVSIDEQGQVSAAGPGSATITAAKATDSKYLAANAEYTIKVNVGFTAWIGPNDTLVDFPSTASGLEFYRSSEADCDLENYASCNNGQLDFLTDETVIDSAAIIQRPGYYTLKSGVNKSSLAVNSKSFSPRADHYVVKFLDKLWMIGGENGIQKNDYWSSSDGVNWIQHTPINSNGGDIFPARSGHQLVVFQGKLWLIGGYGRGSTYYNDVWSSADGVTWTEQNPNAGFSARAGHQVVVNDGQLWLIGGGQHSVVNRDKEKKNDVWSSSDGIVWTERTANASFPERYEHQVSIYNNQFWLIGGRNNNAYFNDIWSSNDGVTWTQINLSGAFTSRYGHRVVVYRDRLWLIGGFDQNYDYQSDVWSSTDGVIWAQHSSDSEFSPRLGHQLVAYKDQLWLFAGRSYGYEYKNDTWVSIDGITWRQKSNGAAFTPRYEHQVVSFLGKLWLIGGRWSFWNHSGRKNDVWSSTDGINWMQHNPINSSGGEIFIPRSGHQVVVYKNKLWLIGGKTTPSNYSSGVWSSSDGISWTQEVESAEFSERFGHQVLIHNNQMWLVGGYLRAGGIASDVWSTDDGVNWIQKKSSADFLKRVGHRMISFDDKLLVIGGINDDISFANEVWSSNDGINWTQQTTHGPTTGQQPFYRRKNHQVAVYDNQLWLIGGRSRNSFSLIGNDVWSSSDGITWTQKTLDAGFSKRADHQVVVHQDKLWLIGGLDVEGPIPLNVIPNNNDIWVTTNGVEWRKGYHGTFRYQ